MLSNSSYAQGRCLNMHVQLHYYICLTELGAYPVTTAGPRALAGLMQLELIGPVIHMLKVMPRAIAKGPNCPQPLQKAQHTT